MENKKFKIGQLFKIINVEGSIWGYAILAQVLPHLVCFVDLKKGNRISDPYSVDSVYEIESTVLDKISGQWDWELIDFSNYTQIELSNELIKLLHEREKEIESR